MSELAVYNSSKSDIGDLIELLKKNTRVSQSEMKLTLVYFGSYSGKNFSIDLGKYIEYYSNPLRDPQGIL